MSSIIKFNIFREFPPNISQNIKSFYISYDFGYCVTNDNKVYVLGENENNRIGFYESNDNKYYLLITELCEQMIEEFYEGCELMFARSCDNQIFSWGSNEFGLLGRGYKSDEYLKPQRISFFDDKNIINVSCSWFQCLALSSEGVIYEWNNNNQNISQILVNEIKIKSVFNNFFNFSEIFNLLVQTFDGSVYKFVSTNISNEELSYEWKSLPNLNEKIKEENNENKIIDLCFVSAEDLICQTDYSVFSISNLDSVIQKTFYKTLFEYFLFETQKTYKTIYLKSNQLFVIKFDKIDEKSEHFDKNFEKINYSNDSSLKTHEENYLTSIRISNDLPQTIKSNVKCFYRTQYLALFVMNDNSVYCIGNEPNGKLGLGHDKKIHEYTLIPELCEMDVEEFYEGEDCMFATNGKNQIFSWGSNEFGQLSRGYRSGDGEFLKPEKIDFFDDKNIINISCGYNHCLMLSSDGKVYDCGDINFGQDQFNQDLHSNVLQRNNFNLTPIRIDFKNKIKYIYCEICNENICCAVDVKGNAYYWKRIDNKNMSEFTPKLIPLKKVSKICYYDSGVYIILDKNGNVFLFNTLIEELNEIKCEEEFTDLYKVDDSYYILQSELCVYELEQASLKKTNYINFYDFYSHKDREYRKTIHITREGYLMTKQIDYNKNHKSIINQDKLVFDDKFENSFEELEELGSGSYGQVMKVRKNINNVIYALKRVQIKDELDLKEIQIIHKLNSDFVVQYFESWIEVKVVFKTIKRFLFIQMELCSQSLRDFIKSMNQITDEKFQTFNYFISSELLRELIECVNYLHSLNPPIIHRDLKPENILISNGFNGRFLKLCDFGLSKIHEKSFHSQMVGTDNYMAPEVRFGENYNLKSDIYSLALIATEVFQFPDKITIIRRLTNLSKYYSIYSNGLLENQFKKVLEMLEICLFSGNFEERPDSRQLLQKIDDFIIDKTLVKNDLNISIFRETLKKLDNNFIEFIFEYKLDRLALSNISIEHIVSKDALEHSRNSEKSELTGFSVYENMFDDISEFGSGSYGTVFKVKNKLTDEIFAMKKIKINNELDLKEMKIISILNNNKSFDFIVKFINIWIERRKVFKDINEFLFIQMELCSQNLRNIIELLNKISDQKFQTFNYFISCELFKELIECVNYLHSIPIIHRDLKPENILIYDGINGRFLKLCDFGLSKFHEKSNHTRGPGTLSYMAPEVLDSNKYNTKSDIYSLALISTEIFQFEDKVRKIRDQKNLNKYLSKYLGTNLENNFKELLEILSNCLLLNHYNSRPKCEELLDKINKLFIDKTLLFNHKNYFEFKSFIEIPENSFIKLYFERKFGEH